MPIPLGIAQMWSQVGYDAQLLRLRSTLAKQQRTMLDAVSKHFPAECRVVAPSGGYFLWIELPQRVDSLEVHRLALEANISIAPGPMFSARREYRNYIRLNYGHPWTPAMERAMSKLGRIIKDCNVS
jgi:DNA-binding transcriptional MocR family regulator